MEIYSIIHVENPGIQIPADITDLSLLQNVQMTLGSKQPPIQRKIDSFSM